MVRRGPAAGPRVAAGDGRRRDGRPPPRAAADAGPLRPLPDHGQVRRHDGARAGRDRQVAPRQAVRGRRGGAGPGGRRPLPALRRGHHVLAAQGDRRRARRRGRARAAHARRRAGHAGRGDGVRRDRPVALDGVRPGRAVGGAAAARVARPQAPPRRRVRRHPVGGAAAARPDPVPGELRAHRAGRGRLPGPRRPARAPPRLGDGVRARRDRAPAAAVGHRLGPAPARAGGTAGPAAAPVRDPGGRRGQPALPRASRGDAGRRPRRGDAAEHQRAARSAHRRPAPARSAGDRGGRRRGPRLPSRRRHGAARRPERDRRRRGPARARAARAGASGAARVLG